MHKLTLHYFDFDGGRGEPARLAMSVGGVDFEDRRIPLAQWPSVKTEMPFHALPVLDVDGTPISQSNTINRFVGKLAGLYPKDPLQAALCDEVMDAVEDLTNPVVATFGMNDADKKAAREKLAAGLLPLYLERLQAQLDARGGQYFADGRLTVGDLKLFVWLRTLRSGILDHIPADLPDRIAPRLVEHFDRINSHSDIVAYYASR